MRYPIAYTTGILTALMIVAAFHAGGYWLLAIPALIYLFLPFGEQLLGLSRWPSEKRIAAIGPATARAYDAILLAAAWTSVALLGWALWAVSAEPVPLWKFATLVVIVGEYSAFVGILTAHELMHRRSAAKRNLAFLLMSLTGYAHFCVEHVYGHHVRVATPEDPATARKGESLYRFLPRTIVGSFKSAWRLEAERLERAGHGRWSWRNQILRWHGFTLALMIGISLLLGPLALLFFVLQAAFAVFGLEAINYLEHYGLMRERRAGGGYERVRPEHSWNSSHFLSNINMFNLGRHSDHHAQSNRPFYKLRHYDEAPQLPYGYTGSFLLAMVPPLWFKVMDRELERHEARAEERVTA